MPYQMCHLVVRGKWKSPGHSKHKRDDDTHEIKREILRAVGREVYERKVGCNPDIDVNQDNVIVLKGTGHKKGQVHVTPIPAEDFFVLTFVKSKTKDEVRISLRMPSDKPSAPSVSSLKVNSTFLIPRDEDVFNWLLNYLFSRAGTLHKGERLTALIVFSA